MKNIVSTKNISAMFLAVILVAGTIATFSPSFILGAQAVHSQIWTEKRKQKKKVTVSSL